MSTPNPPTSDTPQASLSRVEELMESFFLTIFHFWPEFNSWLDDFADTRFEPMAYYDKRFLLWWGMLMFVLKSGSRRQMDANFRIDAKDTHVLENVNRLAGTDHETVPVTKSVDPLLEHTTIASFEKLRDKIIRRLIRMKGLDRYRLLEKDFVIAIDMTGHLSFGDRQHCEHCLVQEHRNGTKSYYHMVLEAKLVSSSGLALSICSEFVANPAEFYANDKSKEEKKQDCELKAFTRLASVLKTHFPQLRICITADSLYGKGLLLPSPDRSYHAPNA